MNIAGQRTLRALLLVLVGMAMGGTPCSGSDSRGGVGGVVRDASGGVIRGAKVLLRHGQQAVEGSATTDAEGQFRIADVPAGNYELVVRAAGFAEQRVAVRVPSPDATRLAVQLQPGPVRQTITVTAEAGLVEESEASIQPVNVVGEEQVAGRAKAVVAQALAEEPGVQLQRTSATIAGVFVRGLTGNKVNVFVDGVRYSTGSARGGINTFLSLADPAHLAGAEVLHGPSGADYGSDAIGGSVQLITRPPELVPDGYEFRGSWATFFHSADASLGSSLTASLGARKFGFVTSLVGRRHNRLRTGGGMDSHAAVTRFLGLPSSVLLDSRLPGTGFTQYGGNFHLTWTPAPRHSLSVLYQRGQQDGARRYDQLLGGDGNLVAELRNLMLNFFYARYHGQAAGWLDHLTLSYSFNRQREERVNQGGNGDPLAAIVHERERTSVQGMQFRGDKLWRGQQLQAGGEVYLEEIRAPAFAFDPVTLGTSLRRPRVPDRASYRTWGAYLQDVAQLAGSRLKLVGAVRYSGMSYRSRAADAPSVAGRPLWPNDSLEVHDVTGKAGALVSLGGGLTLSFRISRGFRAPHVTDLGTLGLTGTGFEVAAPDVAGMNAQVGSTADATAVSTGREVTQVEPESNLNYDVGLRYKHARLTAEVRFFVNDIRGLIEKQTLILPAGAAGQLLGGEPIVTQNANGAVFVAASPNPVLVRTNFTDARYRGVEHRFELALAKSWSLGGSFASVRAAEKQTGLPPNVEGGTPASEAWLRLRYTSGARIWVESYVHAAGRQSRLSSLDLEDRRTGAARSRSSIASFFQSGARARGLIGAGADGMPGTPDDILLVTGETLAQVQDRVLGTGVSSAPLSRAVPGYLTLNLRGGIRWKENQTVSVDLENLMDRNYRGISWGMDAPGRSVSVRYQLKF